MKITIGFSRPKTFNIFSWAIRLIEKREYSHTYIQIDDMIYHAAHGSVHSLSLANFAKKNECIISYDIELPQESFDLAFDFLKNSLGTVYGFDQILGIFVQKLFRKRESIIVNNSQRMVCSELCARFLIIARAIGGAELDSITPSDLQQILEISYGKNKTN